MDTSYKKDEGEDEGITPDSELSTPYSPNTSQVIDRDDETETTENFFNTTTKPRLTTIIPTSTLSGK